MVAVLLPFFVFIFFGGGAGGQVTCDATEQVLCPDPRVQG